MSYPMDDEDDINSMSITELLLKELEAEALKPNQLECNDDFEYARDSNTPPPINRKWTSVFTTSSCPPPSQYTNSHDNVTDLSLEKGPNSNSFPNHNRVLSMPQHHPAAIGRSHARPVPGPTPRHIPGFSSKQTLDISAAPLSGPPPGIVPGQPPPQILTPLRAPPPRLLSQPPPHPGLGPVTRPPGLALQPPPTPMSHPPPGPLTPLPSKFLSQPPPTRITCPPPSNSGDPLFVGTHVPPPSIAIGMGPPPQSNSVAHKHFPISAVPVPTLDKISEKFRYPPPSIGGPVVENVNSQSSVDCKQEKTTKALVSIESKSKNLSYTNSKKIKASSGSLAPPGAEDCPPSPLANDEVNSDIIESASGDSSPASEKPSNLKGVTLTFSVPPPTLPPLNVPPPVIPRSVPFNVPPPVPFAPPPPPMFNASYSASYPPGPFPYQFSQMNCQASLGSLPISVTSIPDTTLATQLKSIKKKNKTKKEVQEPVYLSTTTKDIESGVPEAGHMPSSAPPIPDSISDSPSNTKKDTSLRHIKEHKIVMKLDRRTVKEPETHSNFTQRLLSDCSPVSYDEASLSKLDSQKKKALQNSITSVRLGENEDLSDLYSKLKKLNKDLEMLQQRNSSSSSDDEDNRRDPEEAVDCKDRNNIVFPPAPGELAAKPGSSKPNLDVRIRMMINDKSAQSVKKSFHVTNTSHSKKRPTDINNRLQPKATSDFDFTTSKQRDELKSRLPLKERMAAALESIEHSTKSDQDTFDTLLERPPSPFLSQEIYYYWHKESHKFNRFKKKNYVACVDPKICNYFHKDKFARVQSQPLHSKEALNFNSMLDKSLDDEDNKQLTEEKKEILSKELQADMQRLEAINRELMLLEELEKKEQKAQKEDEEFLKNLKAKQQDKKFRKSKTASESLYEEEDLCELERMRQRLLKLVGKAENSNDLEVELSMSLKDNARETLKSPDKMDVDDKALTDMFREQLDDAFDDDDDNDLLRLEEINEQLKKMDTEDVDFGAPTAKEHDFSIQSDITSYNCLQESLAFEFAWEKSNEVQGANEITTKAKVAAEALVINKDLAIVDKINDEIPEIIDAVPKNVVGQETESKQSETVSLNMSNNGAADEVVTHCVVNHNNEEKSTQNVLDENLEKAVAVSILDKNKEERAIQSVSYENNKLVAQSGASTNDEMATPCVVHESSEQKTMQCVPDGNVKILPQSVVIDCETKPTPSVMDGIIEEKPTLRIFDEKSEILTRSVSDDVLDEHNENRTTKYTVYNNNEEIASRSVFGNSVLAAKDTILDDACQLGENLSEVKAVSVPVTGDETITKHSPKRRGVKRSRSDEDELISLVLERVVSELKKEIKESLIDRFVEKSLQSKFIDFILPPSKKMKTSVP